MTDTPRPHRPRRSLVALLGAAFAFLVVASACSSSGDDAASTSSTRPAAASSTATTEPARAVTTDAGGGTSPSGTATPAADFAGKFDVGGGRMMYMECRGTGSPTVVLVSGQRGSADDWSIVADGVDSPPVFSLVSEKTRVCAYDRPGTPVGEVRAAAIRSSSPRPPKAWSRTSTLCWRRQTSPSRS